MKAPTTRCVNCEGNSDGQREVECYLCVPFYIKPNPHGFTGFESDERRKKNPKPKPLDGTKN